MISEAITAYGKPLDRIESGDPIPQGTEVLVKVSHCGVCHSDVHLHDGYFDLGGGSRLDMTRGRQLPFTLGHEIEGEVAGFGPDAEGVTRGQRAVIFPWIGCGACATCARGDEHLCGQARQLGVNVAGGFATYCLVPHPRYLIDATGVPAGLAATYMCSGVTAFSALKKLGEPARGDSILIVGAGGVGLMALQFALALFPQAQIIVADINAKKRDAALAAGAHDTYDPGVPGAAKQFMADTNGGAFGVIDFVGAESSLGFATGTIRRGREVIVVGLFGGALNMPIPMFPLRVIGIRGSFVGSLAETHEMMALVRAGKIKPIPVEERALDQATRTLNDLRAGRILGRVVLKP